jgi:hypothetical protein
MNEALLNRDVTAVCTEVARHFTHKDGARRMLAEIRAFAMEHLLFVPNTYVLEFYVTRCKDVERTEGRLQRIAAIELASFVSICSRAPCPPRPSKGITKNPEVVLTAELRRILRGESPKDQIVERCVTTLVKSEDTSKRMWTVAEQLSSHREHVQRLRAMTQTPIARAKQSADALCAAFRTLWASKEYYRDISEYKPIVMQCMIKGEYLYESMDVVDGALRLYESCLYYQARVENAMMRRTRSASPEPTPLRTVTL